MQKSASAYERHQSILELVQRYQSVRVPDLAKQLHVSESTIRTDLEILDEQGLLVRVRGGAIARQSLVDNGAPSTVLQRSSQNAREKQSIARWAASMIEDGDVIMLDASSTVLHIAPFLGDRRNLTVLTNGVGVAQALAREPSNTVILLGGILRPNGNALTGEISKQVLQDYRVQTAFVSCSGFTVAKGFFEPSLQEAQMKVLMLQASERCVALLDSSKIGSIGLTAFASLDDVDYFVTDEKIDSQSIEQIRATHTHVIVCADQTSRTYAPINTQRRQSKYRIGFANLTEHTPFSRDVRRSLERAAQVNEVELIIADNQLDPQVALQVADEFISQSVDLVIEYQIDETIGNLIAHRFQQVGIPVVAVDIPMVGAVYFGVDNYIAGKMAGVELGKAIQEKWQGNFDYLIVIKQQRAGSLPAMRIQGQLDGLEQVVLPTSYQILQVDSDNTFEGTYVAMKNVFSEFTGPARIAVICFNDDAAVGTLYAAQETGFADNLLLAGQGADRRLRAEMRKDASPVVGSTAYRPEDYGGYLTSLALDILSGKQVPPAVYMEHFFVSPKNVDEYYPSEAKD